MGHKWGYVVGADSVVMKGVAGGLRLIALESVCIMPAVNQGVENRK
jgi:hypothetical protein